MTRWHEEDLAGRLIKEMKEGGEHWEVIRFPALAEKDDPLGRQEGEALWPERYDIRTLLVTKKVLGSYWWSALYQQKPRPEQGDIFKRHWWQWYTSVPPKFDQIIQSWDMTFKDKKTSAYVCGEVWGRIKADCYLLHLVRGKLSFTKTLQAVRLTTHQWPNSREKLIEEAANGNAVMDTLKSEIPGIIGVQPHGSKEARAHAVSPMVESGNVYLPVQAIATFDVDEFLEEVSSFPNSTYKDQVDAMTQALARLGKARPVNILPISIGGESKWRI